ncbi:XkdF-like putative serine protease domain-containing protein [Stella sp.]|uniref:XkdF-like putative serine protease domain-containing protein n=1 Tax=Stella sp. TaxID=2912054 RepID=UPI0035AF198F
MIDHPFRLTLPIAKADGALRTVWGWASVSVEDGSPLVDAEGDTIATDELVRAAHAFMAHSRRGAAGHADGGGDAPAVGTVVESLVVTPAIREALAIGDGREGWFVGIRIADDAVWAAVLAGELSALSIGGVARRLPA